MKCLRTFLCVTLICLLMSLASSCQRRQSYTSEQLGLTISYPADWTFLEESEGVIMLRSFYKEDTTIRITVFETQLTDTDPLVLLKDRLHLWAQENDPNKPIKYGEIQEISHEKYSIVTGRVSGYSKIKVTPVDFLFHTYVAVIRFQDRVVIVTAGGTGHESQINAINEIIKGLEFR